MDYRDEAPQIVRDFLTYNETIRGKSKKTTQEYYLDLRTFFRYIKQKRKLSAADRPFDEIPISDVGLDLIRTITLSDILRLPDLHQPGAPEIPQKRLHHLRKRRLDPRAQSLEHPLVFSDI